MVEPAQASGGPVPTSAEEVLVEIRRLVREELKLARDVQPSDRLLQDLELDSMTLTTLAVALEDRFQVALTDAPADQLETVGGLARYVAHLRGAAALDPAPAGAPHPR